jgi:tape measure domain-containing protein
MATDVERLVVSLEASITKYERAMNKALGQTNTTTRRIESRFDAMNRRVSAGFGGLQRGIAAAFAGVAATRGATQLIDAATRIENSLKVAGLAGEELSRVYDSLFASAQRNAAPIESLATLYGRLAIVQNELGASTEEMLSFTDNVAVALRVAGTDAQSASGALLQLSQAMGSGVVRAEEFNSILEGALPIAQAAAAGLEEAGGSVAKLRQLVVDGKVSSEAFFRAFEAGSVVLQDKVANAELTVSQGFVRLQNVLIDVAKEMNEGSRVSGALTDGLDGLGKVVQDVAAFAEAAVGPISNMASALGSASDAIRTFIERGAALNGLDQIGANAARWINDLQIPGLVAGSSRAGNVLSGSFDAIGGDSAIQDAADRIAEGLRDGIENIPQITVNGNGAPVPPPRPEGLGTPGLGGRVNPITLGDYPVGGAAGRGSGSSGGGGSANAYQQAIAAREKAIQQLAMEAALTRQATLANNDHGFSVERLRAQMELENAAIEAGLALTPERRAEIDQLSESYARASANAEAMAAAQQLAEQAFDDLASAGRNALDTIIDGFLEGRDAGEIFNTVLKDLAKNLINIGLSQLGGGIQASGFNPFGFLGSLFGFAGGGYTGPGGKHQVAGIVHGGEYVFSKEATQRAGIGNLDAMHRSLKGYANGGYVGAIPRMPGSATPQALTVRIVSDDEKFSAFVEDKAGRVVAQSAPTIVGAAVGRANKSAPAAMARHQQQRAGSDYRIM